MLVDPDGHHWLVFDWTVLLLVGTLNLLREALKHDLLLQERGVEVAQIHSLVGFDEGSVLLPGRGQVVLL